MTAQPSRTSLQSSPMTLLTSLQSSPMTINHQTGQVHVRINNNNNCSSSVGSISGRQTCWLFQMERKIQEVPDKTVRRVAQHLHTHTRMLVGVGEAKQLGRVWEYVLICLCSLKHHLLHVDKLKHQWKVLTGHAQTDANYYFYIIIKPRAGHALIFKQRHTCSPRVCKVLSDLKKLQTMYCQSNWVDRVGSRK